ncbi:MAG TPA: HyaD/HybD family hydrogenase maturation endopeptidase [Gemmatimonadales bacterium]|nr:HyaD/HybD family hydrogenase maturation endopeptidase [Gemmatimonadales bacterium]
MSSGTVVIGLGNPLMGDDGLGIVVARQLLSRTDLPDGVQVVDGGTWGLNLLPVIEDAERVLLVDAIDMAEAPGTLIRLSREHLPRYLATKISPHQVDLRDVLALAELRGTLPEDTTAIGLQPQIVALGTALSPLIAGRMEELVSAVLDHLRAREPACTK